jgi:hypothetical protein
LGPKAKGGDRGCGVGVRVGEGATGVGGTGDEATGDGVAGVAVDGGRVAGWQEVRKKMRDER